MVRLTVSATPARGMWMWVTFQEGANKNTISMSKTAWTALAESLSSSKTVKILS